MLARPAPMAGSGWSVSSIQSAGWSVMESPLLHWRLVGGGGAGRSWWGTGVGQRGGLGAWDTQQPGDLFGGVAHGPQGQGPRFQIVAAHERHPGAGLGLRQND